MSKLLTIAELNSIRDDTTSIAPVYVCPICKTPYKSEATALKCATRSDLSKPIAAAGDIVCMELGYGWHDGNPAWLIDGKGYKFHDKHTLRFWFVVTAVTQRASHEPDSRPDVTRHQIVYHVQTLAVKNGHAVGLCGWTTPDGHHGFKKIDVQPPAEVVGQSKVLVGQVFSRLL